MMGSTSQKPRYRKLHGWQNQVFLHLFKERQQNETVNQSKGEIDAKGHPDSFCACFIVGKFPRPTHPAKYVRLVKKNKKIARKVRVGSFI